MDHVAPRRANIELKARYPDHEKAAEIAERIGARRVHREIQTDTYFSTGLYRLKLRESSLGDHWLIGYQRPNEPGARKSSYRLEKIPDPGAKRKILARTMGVKTVVRKQRTLYLVGPVRIHLDRVEGLGNFIEFEAVLSAAFPDSAAHRRVEELREEFGIPDEDLISGSYSDLFAAVQR